MTSNGGEGALIIDSYPIDVILWLDETSRGMAMTAEFLLSLFGAVCGLIGMITSVIAIRISWRQHILDRPNLEMSAKMSQVWSRDIPMHHLRFEFKAVNTGRRVIRITKAGIEVHPPIKETNTGLYRKTEMVYFNAQDPGEIKNLDENEMFYHIEEPFENEIAKKMGEYGTAFIEDTTGKRHRIKFEVQTLSA